jgi:hypothetical protein
MQPSVPAALHIQSLLQVIQQIAGGAYLSPRSLLINPQLTIFLVVSFFIYQK